MTLISFITIVINLLLVNFFIVKSIFDFINRNTAINEELSSLDHPRCFPALTRSGTLCSWIVFLSCTIIPKKQMTSARLTRLTSAWFFFIQLVVLYPCRSSPLQVFCLKGFQKNFAKFKGKNLRWSHCFRKAVGC